MTDQSSLLFLHFSTTTLHTYIYISAHPSLWELIQHRLVDVGLKGLQVILEAKEPLEKGTLPPNASDMEREDALFVGMMTLRMVLAKSRDAEFSIGLVEKWRGRGYGTEAMQWLVKHSFEQLALHRLSLEVVESNATAISLYKSV
jgi:ribosomal protein S18 acetylase RimI-like enzyme